METLQTIDAGEVEVQLSPIGEFLGSNAKGEPVRESITQESLESLATALNSANQEILCDIDHASCKPGAEKDSKAAGWFSNFKANVKGLFATLKLTELGRHLVQTRAFRFLSPVFALNAAGEPTDMHSAALTNTPAFKGFIEPILNAEPTEQSNIEEDVLNMTKEELVSLIKETVVALNAAPCEEKKEDEAKCEEPKAEETPVEEPKAEEKTEVENACSEVKNEETAEEKPAEEPKAEEPKAEEPKEEAACESPAEETKCEAKEEVIKLETLNSAPTLGIDVAGKEVWKDLHGKDFFDWLKKGEYSR